MEVRRTLCFGCSAALQLRAACPGWAPAGAQRSVWRVRPGGTRPGPPRFACRHNDAKSRLRASHPAHALCAHYDIVGSLAVMCRRARGAWRSSAKGSWRVWHQGRSAAAGPACMALAWHGAPSTHRKRLQPAERARGGHAVLRGAPGGAAAADPRRAAGIQGVHRAERVRDVQVRALPAGPAAARARLCCAIAPGRASGPGPAPMGPCRAAGAAGQTACYHPGRRSTRWPWGCCRVCTRGAARTGEACGAPRTDARAGRPAAGRAGRR